MQALPYAETNKNTGNQSCISALNIDSGQQQSQLEQISELNDMGTCRKTELSEGCSSGNKDRTTKMLQTDEGQVATDQNIDRSSENEDKENSPTAVKLFDVVSTAKDNQKGEIHTTMEKNTPFQERICFLDEQPNVNTLLEYCLGSPTTYLGSCSQSLDSKSLPGWNQPKSPHNPSKFPNDDQESLHSGISRTRLYPGPNSDSNRRISSDFSKKTRVLGNYKKYQIKSHEKNAHLSSALSSSKETLLILEEDCSLPRGDSARCCVLTDSTFLKYEDCRSPRPGKGTRELEASITKRTVLLSSSSPAGSIWEKVFSFSDVATSRPLGQQINAPAVLTTKPGRRDPEKGEKGRLKPSKKKNIHRSTT